MPQGLLLLPRMSPACSVVVVVAAAAVVAVAACCCCIFRTSRYLGQYFGNCIPRLDGSSEPGLAQISKNQVPHRSMGGRMHNPGPIGKRAPTVESNSGKETTEFCPYVGRGIAFFWLAGLKFAQDFPGSKSWSASLPPRNALVWRENCVLGNPEPSPMHQPRLWERRPMGRDDERKLDIFTSCYCFNHFA